MSFELRFGYLLFTSYSFIVQITPFSMQIQYKRLKWFIQQHFTIFKYFYWNLLNWNVARIFTQHYYRLSEMYPTSDKKMDTIV